MVTRQILFQIFQCNILDLCIAVWELCIALGKEPLDAGSICRVAAILTAAQHRNYNTMLGEKSVITVINHLPYHLALLPYHIIDYLLVMSNTQGLLLHIQFTVIIRLLTMK